MYILADVKQWGREVTARGARAASVSSMCMYVDGSKQVYGPRPCVGHVRKRTAQGGAGVGHKDQASGQPCHGYSERERAELGRQAGRRGIPLRFARRDAVAADGHSTDWDGARGGPSATPSEDTSPSRGGARARRSCRLWCRRRNRGTCAWCGVPRSCVRPPSDVECGASSNGHWRESGRRGWNKGAAMRWARHAAVRRKSET